MAKARQVVLSEQQRRELSWVRDHHPKASVRTRAAAILKVADGQSMSQVARTGLLKTVRYETVSDWITRYEQEGLTGFYVQPGRGRKAVFCTVHDDVEVVRADLQGLLSRSPRLYDLPTSRLPVVVAARAGALVATLWQAQEAHQFARPLQAARVGCASVTNGGSSPCIRPIWSTTRNWR